MPIPKPRKGETERDFIDRCMGDGITVRDFPDTEIRSGVCFSQWRNRDKSGNTMMLHKYLDSELELKAVRQSGEFEGYGSVFNNVDEGRDMVLPGAFKASLKKRTPMMSFQHDITKIAGAYKTIREDDSGLYVKGVLNLNTELGRDTYELMRSTPAAIKGMSIGYNIAPGGMEMDMKRGIRKLKTLDVFDVSLVTVPMNPRANVARVKSMLMSGAMPEIGDFEDFLRDAGLSRKQSKALLSKGFEGLSHLRDADDDDDVDFNELKIFIDRIQRIS